MKNLITYFENTGVNWSVIWSDCSLFICLFLLFVIVSAYWWHKKTIQEMKYEYKTESNNELCALNSQIIALQKTNNDLTIRLQKTERKRDEKGLYLPISGKGHGKKKNNAD